MTIPLGEQNSAYGLTLRPGIHHAGALVFPLAPQPEDPMLLHVALLASTLTTAAPDPVRYRIEQRTENRLDLSGFGQGEQVQNQAFAWFLSITYADSAGGTVVRAVVDSAQMDLGMMATPTASLDSLRGLLVHGWMDATGKMESATAAQASTFSSQVEGLLRSFHPRVRAGARVGDRWSDTTVVNTKAMQMTTNTSTVSTYTMAGPGSLGGANGLVYDVSFSSDQKGALDTPAGPADLVGKTAGNGKFLVSATGRYLGSESTSTGEATISGSFAPMAIPVRTSSSMVVTLLK